jgi:hypothetical protein
MSWAVSLAEGNLGRGMKWVALENLSTKDGGVTIRQRETSDNVQGYMGSGAMRNTEWLK